MIFLSTLLISLFVTMALIPMLRMAALRLHCGVGHARCRARCTREPKPKVGGLAMAVGALVPVLFVADGGRLRELGFDRCLHHRGLRAGGRLEPGLEGQVRRADRRGAGRDPLRRHRDRYLGSLPARRGAPAAALGCRSRCWRSWG